MKNVAVCVTFSLELNCAAFISQILCEDHHIEGKLINVRLITVTCIYYILGMYFLHLTVYSDRFSETKYSTGPIPSQYVKKGLLETT